jgi:hypothetical protein
MVSNKLTLLMSFLIVSVSCAYGQFSVGVKGGFSDSDLISKGIPDGYSFNTNRIQGFHVGLFTQIRLKKKFSLVPELQYSQRGFIDPGNNALRNTLSYLEMPVLITYAPIKFVSIELGPNVSYLLSVATNLKPIGFSSKSLYKPVDLGVSGGLGINLTTKWSIVVRYYRGLTALMTINYYDGINPATTAYFYNKNFQASIAYRIQ